MKKNKNNILIAGGGGFIGVEVCFQIFKSFKKSNLYIVDKLTYSGNKIFLKELIKSKRVFFFKKDIVDIEKLKSKIKNVSVAINIAAESHVDRSFKSSTLFTKTNTLGAHCFYQFCLENKVDHIIHVSTDEVYGEKLKGLNYENDQLNPTNPYSASKAAAEIILNTYKKFIKNQTTIVRSNNIFGTRQYPEKLIPSCILSIIKNKKIKIHGDGKHIRTYLSVKDFGEAIILIIKKKILGTINLGSNERFQNKQVANKICRLMGKDPVRNITYTQNRPFNDQRYAVSTKKIKKYGWKPKNKLLDELPSIINWYKNNYKFFKKP